MDRNPDAQRLLQLVTELVTELFPGAAQLHRIQLGSVLDRELGLDSLARVELFARVEREFGVHLGEDIIERAGTVADLLTVLRERRAEPASPAPAPSSPRPAAASLAVSWPVQANTLTEVLGWYARSHGERVHIRLLEDTGETAITYAQLFDQAGRVAAGLAARGFRPGSTAAIMLPTGVDYFAAFFGIALAGGIPVPIYPPVRPNQLEDHLRRHKAILDNCEASCMITVGKAMAVARLFQAQVLSLADVTTVPDLMAGQAPVDEHAYPARADDLAFLQYTSGSTGTPKGVMLTHANLLANIRAMGAAVGVTPDDVFVSWLPLYHDMGLIGAWLGSLYHAMELVVMSPLRFLSRPSNWLEAIDRYRGTISAGPNFAYALATRRIAEADSANWDLSSWRFAFNGAEPVHPDTLDEFARRFAPARFDAHALAPVYGLAECSVGLAFPPPARGPRVERILRTEFEASGRAIFAPEEDPGALRFVAGGAALPDHEIRVVGDDDREQPEGVEGRLQFRGPSATSGYFRNAEATRELLSGDWLDSGDLAYLRDGEVFITGRRKDVIIIAGRNIYPHDLEEVVGALPGVRQGCVAVFATARDTGTEGFVVLAETRETSPQARQVLRDRVVSATVERLGVPPDQVALVAPHSVLKTSSGKIRRQACRLAYERGRMGSAPIPVWRQVLRLLADSWPMLLKRARAAIWKWAFGGWAWCVLLVLAIPTWIAVATLPGRNRRWATARASARLLLRCLRIPLQVDGMPDWPPGGCVLVANHASYIDGAVLQAALPRAVCFVAKGELARQFVAGTFLRGIGATFVDRAGGERALEDAEAIVAAVRDGKAVLFFPEGTFTRAPGLRAFRLGAFETAVRAGAPVMPIAIRGTRSILREDTWLPRPGSVSVHFGAVITPPDNAPSFASAVALRDRVRQALLRRTGEPDLGAAHAMPEVAD